MFRSTAACAVSAFCCLGFVGCSEPPGAAPATPTGPEELVDHAAWSMVDTAEADPFAAHGRPTVHACEDEAYFQPTPGALEIELARCRQRYVSIHQPSLVDLYAGDHLQFTLAHQLLRPVTESVTEAYVALAVNGGVVWELTIQILAPANGYTLDVPVTAELAAGSDVVLHINNHGENSYTFSPITVVRESSEP